MCYDRSLKEMINCPFKQCLQVARVSIDRSVVGLWSLTRTPMRAVCLVAMAGDSSSRGHEFESQHQIVDGQFFTFI